MSTSTLTARPLFRDSGRTLPFTAGARAPRSDRAAGTDGLTLAQRLDGVWEEIGATATASCPVCSGRMSGGSAGASCTNCGTTLAAAEGR